MKKLICIFTLGLIIFTAGSVRAQLVVNGKNINDVKSTQYIQFTYYIEKNTLKPVYYIDYGMMDNEAPIDQKPSININNVVITPNMSPMLVLNKLYEAGWEYLGDFQYTEPPMMDRWYIYTLKRKEK